MNANNPIKDLLAASLGPDWTVESLAERLLCTIAAHQSSDMEFILDGSTATDRQSRRLLRPLLACLATLSATEAGTPVNIYGGHLSFKRLGPDGPVWILGQFENTQETTRIVFRRSPSPEHPEPKVPEGFTKTNTFATKQ